MGTLIPILVVAFVWFMVGWLARGEFSHRKQRCPNVIDLTGARRRERRSR